MSTPNPVQNSQSSPPVSSATFHIAGILTTVYGLDELSLSSRSVSCLWLLHPRLSTKQVMDGVAASCIHAWNQRPATDRSVGLIAVSFDQRNHGSREVLKKANEAWRDGNETHAQDMFSVFNGTALDTSLLIDHLGSYILHGPGSPVIKQHIVMGISLGGHAAWQVLFHDPRVTAGVVIIGCPDYMRVMTDRARLSKRSTYTSSGGASFLGSTDFPSTLISSVEKWDPKGILFSTSEITTSPQFSDQKRLRQILDSKIKGKRILVCSGGADKLVPYHASETFMKFLKNATAEGGWYENGNVYVEDKVYEGVGHKYSEGMVRDTVRFVCDTLAGGEDNEKKASKI